MVIPICLPLLSTNPILYKAMLQIRRGNKVNLGIIFHIFPQNVFCDPSLELSHRDGSNVGSQYMFSLRNKKNYL